MKRRAFIATAALGAIGYLGYRGCRHVQVTAERSRDSSHLKQLSFALLNYRDAEGHFPPAFIRGPDGRPWHSWRLLIQPYFEGQLLYDAYDFEEPWDGPRNRRLIERMPDYFRFSRGGPDGVGVTKLVAVVGQEAPWPGATMRKDLSDDTPMIVENHGAGIRWTEPRDLDFSTMDFTLGSANGVSSIDGPSMYATGNGDVRTFALETTPAELRAMFVVPRLD